MEYSWCGLIKGYLMMNNKIKLFAIILLGSVVNTGCQKAEPIQIKSNASNLEAERLYNEGRKLYLGNDVNIDYKRAFNNIGKSASMGNIRAQNDLGQMYYDGTGTNRDFKNAYFWFEKAANQGDPAALYNLGVMYKKGGYLQQSDTKAFYYFNKSANKGFIDAKYALANAYFKGGVLTRM